MARIVRGRLYVSKFPNSSEEETSWTPGKRASRQDRLDKLLEIRLGLGCYTSKVTISFEKYTFSMSFVVRYKF